MLEKQRQHLNTNEPLQLNVDELDHYFNLQDGFDQENVETQILYIKRTDAQGDRFAGHVVFPGGKQEQNESLLETAIRETKEEIGLDLTDSENFAFIHKYPLVIPFFFMKGRRRMFVHPFIFVQLTFEDLQVTFQEREIQGSIWTSLEYLADNDDRFLWYRPQKHARYKTNFILLMPTFLLLNAVLYNKESAYKNPNLVDRSYPLGGMTVFLTGHMLAFGEYITDNKRFQKYQQYRIQEIKNEKVSVLLGTMFSRMAISPHYYLREAWKEYKYIFIVVVPLLLYA